MLIRLDPDSDTALFVQVADSIRMDAAAGRLRPGERLPAAREVAALLEINVHTVLHAYQELRDEGLIELRRGRGAVVTPQADALVALTHDIRAVVSRARASGLPAEALASLVKEIARENR
ncbi:GntR family transcriptional regulator [Microbacterium sp. C7(2022)]|uniref:GntR family transcriptional regulator n=1 Tax=Microbacterium sp. C7(2022) TaxID=2992759 RepID=UPI00237B1D65|nr:GntR family transcriptional regulator [Microbacterium sp. C7(2022)]MDE0545791.1 GntR family transcriptional regulator [Microbacterium sp. C7(2022)]